MKKLFLSVSVMLIFASCASTGVNSNYKKKEYTSKGKAVLVGGIVANVTCKQADTGTIGSDFSGAYSTVTSFFKSKEKVAKELRESEGTVMKGESKLMLVKPENINKDNKYADYEIGGFDTNDANKISIMMVEPGKYILKGYRFKGANIHVGEKGYQTGEYYDMKYIGVNNVPIELVQGDVVYIGNFEIDEKDEKHTVKTIDQSTKVKEYFNKKHPELVENMKVNIVKLDKIN